MMATVPHITYGLGLRKFQADGFLFNRVYIKTPIDITFIYLGIKEIYCVLFTKCRLFHNFSFFFSNTVEYARTNVIGSVT